jgi:hypothetical protein
LAAYNANPASTRKLRLRMAVHFGTAMPADNGFAGQGVVAVSRLVESAPVKNALTAAPQACLAVILSRQIFDDVVRQGHVSASAEEFARVSVQVKEFQDEAWLKVVGIPHPAVDDPPASGRSQASETAADARIQQIFHGDVHAPGATFGISHGA